MKCPKCNFENPDGLKFCGECGQKLELKCPQCGFLNPPQFKFCGECGHKLGAAATPVPKELTFEEKLDKIRRYLPKDLTEKILSQRGRIEGERKQVTVMFCDLEGFTPLVEKIGADEAYTVMDQVYELLIHCVRDYEGTVNEMKGDGIIALFGAPIALEDASQRAIRSALAVHREMARLNARLSAEGKEFSSLRMRIGIHSGPVVVGTLGNDLRVEFKAVGDTVNLASRMESLAEPGTTYVSAETFKLTEGLFRFEALGAKEIKGKEEPVVVYRVITTSSRRTRFDVNAERGLTPLVGRERELDILLEGFEMVKTGRGQAFSIVAEAGAGKSRLLYEFHKAVTNEEVTILEGKCLSYARNVAYHPVIDILKANFKIDEADEGHEIKRKVTNRLSDIGIEPTSMSPYLLDMLSVKESGIDELNISPELKKERVVGSLLRIILKGSEQAPLIMIFEDLHWVDNTTEALLKDILDGIPGSRVLLLFSYRPEFIHTWGGKSYHNQLSLNRLSNRESLTMLSHLLGSEDADDHLQELVLSKTEGIPFFVEEFVKSLMNLKLIEKQEKYCLVKDAQIFTIPSTIQDMIMARVDALPDIAKEILQAGSVIEREFPFELLKAVMSMSEQELLSNLSLLKDSELLYERGIYPDSTFIFKHALTREVVYDSILSNKRKALHQEAGNTIEKTYQQNIMEHYESLAGHFIKGKNYIKGAEYSRLASSKALQSNQSLEAIKHSENRVFCIEKLVNDEGFETKIVEARTELATVNLVISRHIAAAEAVTPIVDLAEKLNHQRSLPSIYTVLGTHAYFINEDFQKGYDYLKKALKISRATNNLIQQYSVNLYLGNWYAINCEFEDSLEHINEALKIAEKEKNLALITGIKSVMGFENYFMRGNINGAYQIGKEALADAKECETRTKGFAAFCFGLGCYGKRNFEKAEQYLLMAVDYLGKTDVFLYGACACWFLAEVYFHSENYAKAQFYFQKGFSQVKEQKFMPGWIRLLELYLWRSKVIDGTLKIDVQSLIKDHEKYQEIWLFGSRALLTAEILFKMNNQHHEEAEEWINKAIEINTQNGTRFFLGQNYHLYFQFLKAGNKLPQAREQMTNAIEVMKECGADGWVELYEKELTSLA